MKINISILFLLIFFSTKAFAQEEGIVNFSVHIDHPNSDSIFIEVPWPQKTLKVLKLDSTNSASDTLKIKIGFYNIGDGTEITKCFLKPGFDLHLYIDTKAFDETVKYTGKGACENNYLAQKFLLEESLGIKTHYSYWAKLNEKDFIHINDSIFNVFNSFFEDYNKKCKFDSDFAHLAKNDIKYEYWDRIRNYKGFHIYLTKDTSFTLSDTFPRPYKNQINPNDEKLLLLYSYNRMLEEYIIDLNHETVMNIIKKDSTARRKLKYWCLYIDVLDSLISNQKVKEYQIRNFIASNFDNADSYYDELYKKIKKIIKEQENIKLLDSLYNVSIKMAKGTKAPDFGLYDADSNYVTLSSLKGNLVYIDIWSTWCLPCVEEIEPMKKLIEEYKDKKIKFVSICKNDSYERWKYAIKRYDLKGIQLFTSNEDIPFIKHFHITGVPHYILIDAEGKVITHNAYRPSYKYIRDVIDKNLPE